MSDVSPAVTVIMPCRDHGRFLEGAVDSVQAQTFQDFEIVIVDDGSSDPETLAVLARLDRPKTRVLRTDAAGVTRARNLGIREARGRYLCFFDCDDLMHPQLLAQTVAALEADPSLAFASTWVHLFGDEEWDWKPERCDLPALLDECCVATAALVKASVVAEAGGFDESMELGHEDWDLWLAIVTRGHRGIVLPEILFSYRRAGESRSSVADRAGIYLELYRARIAKYRAAYQRELFEVLWSKETRVVGPLSESLSERTRRLAHELEPRVARLREALLSEVEAK